MTDHEMLRLEFADNSAVLAPISELRSIWRYSSDPTAVSFDKAEGSSWERRRVQVEREIAETALHIIKIAAERKKRKAAKITPPAADYERFAARFPYFPTSDQTKAIEDVLQDLASGHPMDRLVSGDVGYGKTEVALRATAAAVFAGKQVAWRSQPQSLHDNVLRPSEGGSRHLGLRLVTSPDFRLPRCHAP